MSGAEALRAYRGLRSMADFAQAMARGRPAYQQAWYHRTICDHLDLALRRARGLPGGLDAVAVFMPPRHGKTLHCAELLPAYAFALDPAIEVISLTYSIEYSKDSRRAVGEIMESPAYRAISRTRIGKGDVEEVDERGRVHSRRLAAEATATALRTLQARPDGTVEPGRGLYLASSLGGKCTGKGANLVVFDDLVKNRAEAESPVERRRVEAEIEQTAFTRTYRDSAQVLLMTRWHELDAGGFIVRKWVEAGLRYAVLTLRAEREDEDLPYDPRQPGEWLDPERFGAEKYRQARALVGEAGWGSLYQQRPTAAGGRPFPRGAWGRFDPSLLGDRDLSILDGIALSVDANLAEGGSSYAQIDEWALVTVPQGGGGRYRKEAWKLGESRGKWSYPDLREHVRGALAKWDRLGQGVSWLLIEDKAVGPALEAEIRAEGRGVEIVRCRTGSLSKETRAALTTHLFRAGLVALPGKAWGPVEIGWVEPHLAEFADFPQGRNDDRVDTCTQFLRWAEETQGLLDRAP